MNYPSLRLSNFIESISLKKKEMNYKNILKHRLTTLNRHAEKKSASLFIEEEKRLIIKKYKIEELFNYHYRFFPQIFQFIYSSNNYKKREKIFKSRVEILPPDSSKLLWKGQSLFFKRMFCK